MLLTYRKKSRFMFNIRDLFYLSRNLDQMRDYTGDPMWRCERDGDIVLSYHGDNLLSKTIYLEDNPPTFLKATVIISGLEEYPFTLEINLEEVGNNQTIVEYKTQADIPEDFEPEVLLGTINEFRKQLYSDFAKAAHNLEIERRRKETATPYVDLDDD